MFYMCKECDNAFLEKSHLTCGTYRKGNLPLKHCGKTWEKSNTRNIRDHIHKPHESSQCGKGFSYVSSHITLENTHRWDTLSVCYTWENILSEVRSPNHQSTHTGLKPYECHTRGTLFCMSSHFRAHERAHTCEKPFLCPDGGESFGQNPHLTQHQRIQKGNRTLCL